MIPPPQKNIILEANCEVDMAMMGKLWATGNRATARRSIDFLAQPAHVARGHFSLDTQTRRRVLAVFL